MSSIPRHGAIHQSQNIDHSQTSYGNYINSGSHASGQSSITHVNTTMNYLYNFASSLEELEKRCSHSAAFDSATRFDPPRCTESTRLRIIQVIEDWINSDVRDAVPSSLFWLHGGAGVGKSAIAQSLSEKYQEREQLAASFFFCRSDPFRNNGENLIPTLVSHLVDTFTELGPFVADRIRKNRTLFTKNHRIQIRELLVEPLRALKSNGALAAHPQLIVIDGLDECTNPDIQCELLRVVAAAIPQIAYPLRFLVTSRPEAHITRVFSHDHDFQALNPHRYNLSDDPDADMDIHKFLEKEFQEIRRVHCLGQHLSHAWPDQGAITSLVERSSAHFIYASTVIRYIRSPRHRPDDRLEVILHLRPHQTGDRPYAQLDALYALIFQDVEGPSLENICLVLGSLYFRSKKVGYFAMASNFIIEKLLGMKSGDLVLLLDQILSLVSIEGGEIRVLHKSLFDYLLDFTRGGHLPFDLARVHELAATYILKRHLVRMSCDIYEFQDFAYHTQFATLNDTLRDYLRSLEFPWPNFVMTVPETFPPWDDSANIFLRQLMWKAFRTLSREDFDSTGQLHEEYVAKCMRYLHLAVPRYSRSRSGPAIAKVAALKRETDELLMGWKPENSKLKSVPVTSFIRRVALIKREHEVYSAYYEASFPGSTNAIASSLVYGDDFIHSYNLGFLDDMFGLVILRTYSKYSYTCYQHARVGHLDKVIQETHFHLRRVENHLYSDLYHMYGLQLEEDTYIT